MTLKLAFTSVFVLFVLSVFSQTLTQPATFTLYEHSACDSSFNLAYHYTLHGNNLTLYPDSTGVIEIYSPGEYTLRHTSAELPFWGKKIQIPESLTDTVEIAPIHLVGQSQGIGPSYYRFYYCGQICDGDLTTLWTDGKIRQEGRFKNGHIKTYKSFYSSGSIKKRSKNGLMTEYLFEYSESGKLLAKIKSILFFNRIVIYDEEKNEYIKKSYLGRSIL